MDMASIEKRSENTYRITVSCGYDVNGKKLFKKKTVTLEPTLTEKQKEKKLNELSVVFEREVRNGTYLDGETITSADFAARWMKDYAEKQLEPKTIYSYRLMLDLRVIPALGHIRLSKLQPIHIIEFYNNLAENGMRLDTKYRLVHDYIDLIKKERSNLPICESTAASIIKGNVTTPIIAERISDQLKIPIDKLFVKVNKKDRLSNDTISHHHKLISTILSTAVHWQVISSNPCERVPPPKVEQKEAKAYDEIQVADMFLRLESEDIQLKVALYIVIYAGVRRQELAGLEWDVINFDEKTIRIKKTRNYTPGVGVYEGPPKRKSSYRFIDIPNVLVNLLRHYKVLQSEERLKYGESWEGKNTILTGDFGRPLFPETPSKWFVKFLKETGLEKITFHQLRHTYASLMIAEGVDPVTVSKQLGHASPSITLNIYSHKIKRASQDAAEKLGALLNPENSNQSSNTM